MNCRWCATTFDARAGAQTCSGKCRVALHRSLANPALPDQLKAIPQWVRRAQKVPMQFCGGHASSTNPATWCDFETARQSHVGDGLGFVLAGNGVVCIDLDHCLTADGLADWAVPIVAQARGTFIEVSQSGTGLHIFGLARISAGRNLGNGVEIYERGRFIAVTGRRFRRAPLKLQSVAPLVSELLMPGV